MALRCVGGQPTGPSIRLIHAPRQVPTNVKAYYRKARACQALHQHEEVVQICDAGLRAAAAAATGEASTELRALRDKASGGNAHG